MPTSDTAAARTLDEPRRAPRFVLLRQERSRRTRDRLVRAALRTWLERDFDQTTVEDIAEAAGVSRSTYYTHFQNKEALLVELARRSAMAASVAVDRSSDADRPVEVRLAAFAVAAGRRIERLPRELVSRVVQSVMRGIGLMGSERTTSPPGFQTALTRIFESAQARGDLGPEHDPAELGAIFAAIMMEAILRWSMRTAGHGSLREALEYRTALFVDGIRARPA